MCTWGEATEPSPPSAGMVLGPAAGGRIARGEVRSVDLSSIFWTLVRRWYAVLPVLILVILAGYAEVSRAATPYEASGEMLLLAPNKSVDAQGQTHNSNPFTLFDGSLKTTATALTSGASSDPSITDAIAQKHLSDQWQATVSATDPIITVTARSPVSRDARATVASVMQLLTARLATLQNSVAAPPGERITAKVIVPAGTPSPLTTDRNRALAATCLLGVLAVVASGLAAESLAGRRLRKRRRLEKGRGEAVENVVDAQRPSRVSA